MNEAPIIYLTSGSSELAQSIRQLDSRFVVELFHESLEISNRAPVWIFIDWLLPMQSGLELCRRLRDRNDTREAHLTLVLETLDADSRRRALAAGADDYLLGPLTAELVESRVMGAPSASKPRLHAVRLRHGSLTLDPAAFQVRFEGQLVTLRPNEFRLLLHLVDHPDQVFSRSALIEHLGKHEEAADERTVDVWVGRLRRALRAQGVPDNIRTVRTHGYVLDSEGR